MGYRISNMQQIRIVSERYPLQGTIALFEIPQIPKYLKNEYFNYFQFNFSNIFLEPQTFLIIACKGINRITVKPCI